MLAHIFHSFSIAIILVLFVFFPAVVESGVIPNEKNAASLKVLNNELDKIELLKPMELKWAKDERFLMEDMDIEAGTELELSCQTAGIPTPVVFWEHNGQRVEGVHDSTIYEKLHNVNKKTIQNGVTVGRIRIPCAQKSDAGTYKCFATNGHSILEKTAHVTVVGSSVCQSTLQPPTISMYTEARFENEDNAVQLFCRSQKDATIAWYDEEHRLLNDLPGFEVTPVGDLLIKHIVYDDHMGQFTCVASNVIGEDRVHSFLYPTEKDPEPTEDLIL